MDFSTWDMIKAFIMYPFKKIGIMKEYLVYAIIIVLIAMPAIGIVRIEMKTLEMKLKCMNDGYVEVVRVKKWGGSEYFCKRRVNGTDEVVKVER